MSTETAFERLRQANPVPRPDLLRTDSDALAAFESTSEQWRTDMDIREQTTKTHRPGPERRRPILVAAGIAAAALLGIGAVLLNDSEGSQRAGQTEIAVAEEFVDAVARWDTLGSGALLAPDATVLVLPARSAEDWEALLRWREASGLSFSLDGCEATVSGQPSVVSCSVLPESAWAQALGVEISHGDTYSLTIEDGRVTVVTQFGENSTDPDSMAQVWNRFHDWVASNHPESLALMHSDDGQADPVLETVMLSEESIDQWATMTEQFAADVGEG